MQEALGAIKTLVRVLALGRAEVITSASGMALRFDDRSPFAGVTLVLSGQGALQAVLPLFKQPAWAHA